VRPRSRSLNTMFAFVILRALPGARHKYLPLWPLAQRRSFAAKPFALAVEKHEIQSYAPFFTQRVITLVVKLYGEANLRSHYVIAHVVAESCRADAVFFPLCLHGVDDNLCCFDNAAQRVRFPVRSWRALLDAVPINLV